MPLGDEGDFRMQGFQQTMRFPAQDRLGGVGSPFPLTLTTPSGGTNMQSPAAPLTLPSFGNPNITLPGVTLPPSLPPVVIQPISSGTAAPTTITVEDLATPAGPFTGIDTLEFDGAVTVTNPAPNVANIFITGGGGGGGTTLVYGVITAATKGTYAQWTYTVALYAAGVATGVSVTAYNLLEFSNNNATAYGYSITGAGYDKVFGTSYYIRSVPVGAAVRMEQTGAMTGTPSDYWFSAPNRIDGGC